MSDEQKHNKEGFGGDDFADDFSDDFGDDFSDELSDDSLGFDEGASTSSSNSDMDMDDFSTADDDFSDETVVYDDDMSEDGAAFGGDSGNPLAEYKKYIVMAFSITLAIIFLVMMMGKKKKKPDVTPDSSAGAVFGESTSSPKPAMDTMPPPKPTNNLANLPKPTAVPPANDSMGSSYGSGSMSSEQFNKIYQETKLVSERLSDVQSQFQTNRSNFSQLNTTLSTLERSVRQANSALTNLNEQMKGIQTELKKQQDFIDTLKKQKMKKSSGKTYKSGMEMVSTPSYYLYAAIPGRAWLKSQSGATLTIAVGSNVPGYGRVTLIEPIKGMVITNKGYIFKFSDK